MMMRASDDDDGDDDDHNDVAISQTWFQWMTDMAQNSSLSILTAHALVLTSNHVSTFGKWPGTSDNQTCRLLWRQAQTLDMTSKSSVGV
jgi:hypothetical protein